MTLTQFLVVNTIMFALVFGIGFIIGEFWNNKQNDKTEEKDYYLW